MYAPHLPVLVTTNTGSTGELHVFRAGFQLFCARPASLWRRRNYNYLPVWGKPWGGISQVTLVHSGRSSVAA